MRINETINHIKKAKGEDTSLQKERERQIYSLNMKSKKAGESNYLTAMENAFLQIMNYKLYKKSMNYKQKELDEEKQKQKEKQEREIQNKISEKQNKVDNLQEENRKKTEQLNANATDAEILAEICSGKLELLPEYMDHVS